MKSTSLSSHGMTTFIQKLIPSREQLKSFTLSDFLSCLIAGVLSQGALFGVLKPFGIAFYAAYPREIITKASAMLAILLGNVIRGDFLTALKQIAVLFLYEWLKKVLPDKEHESALMRNALLLGGATGVTGLFIFLIDEKIIASIMVVIMEVILASIVTALFSITLQGKELSPDEKKSEHQNMEYFGMLVMGGAFLLGASGIHFQGVSFDRMMAGVGLLMLTRHFGPGFGACAGTIAGLALSAGHPGSFSTVIGIYAVSGLISGMLQKSKAISGLCYFLTHAIFFFTTPEYTQTWPDIIIPVVLFWLIPDLKVGKLITIQSLIQPDTAESKKTDRIRQTLSNRLENMSIALYKLGHTIDKQIRDSAEGKAETSGTILEQLTQQVCSCCSKSSTCWETKLFYTHKAMNTLIDVLQRYQPDVSAQMEQELNRFCVKSGLVIDTLMRIIEIKRVDRVWEKTVIETQAAIPEQMYSLSEVMHKISGEFLQHMETFDDEENRVTTQLRKEGLPVLQTEIERGRNGKFSASIKLGDCQGGRKCSKEIEAAVTQVLGPQMLVDENQFSCSGKKECVVNLNEKEAIGITTGIARMKKDRAKVSGDSFTFLKTRDGKYIVAVSDGMGSGREANRLSEAAIGLLEQLLECGLSIRLSLSLVNTMIAICNPEKYATMDISAIDLYTGETEFYKMGAMPSLVISGRNLDFIQINNLPAGLHQENPISFEKRKISDGEFIIMMTDGVYDRLSSGNEKTLLEKVINLKKTLNPQDFAEHLLKSACENTDDISDDMTVLVAKLWRKAG